MPYVNIRVTPPGVPREQKEEVIRRVTDVLVEVMGKPKERIFVVFDELPTENWGIGGESVATRREREAKKQD